MSDFLVAELVSGLRDIWATTSSIEIVAVAFGLLYIVLAAKENSWCWPAAFIGTGTSIYLFWDGRLYMEAVLNSYYLVMAIYGWQQWGRDTAKKKTLVISSFNVKHHAVAITAIAVLTLLSGYLFKLYTDAALPYLDSFTTCAAFITTWMVTRKILENWLYWLVINSAAIILYVDRGFKLYAVMAVVYIVISVFGYLQWRNTYKQTLEIG